jgi:hypothetical protein
MKQFLKVQFSKTPIAQKYDYYIPNSSNEILMAHNQIHSYSSSEDTYTLTIQLIDNPITHKFLKLVNNTNGDDGLEVSCNRYVIGSVDDLIIMQTQMNNIIDQVNNTPDWKKYQIKSDNILEIKNADIPIHSDDLQIHKLNSLHDWFEDTVNDLDTLGIDEPNLIQLCEAVNQLVHSMEGANRNIEQHQSGIRGQMHVFRLTTQDKFTNLKKSPGFEIKLEDADYDHFTVPKQGQVCLDYATVGKSLWHAMNTNDCNLVRNNKISPQEYIKPFFNYRVSTMPVLHSILETKGKMFDWLADNGLAKHVDISDPRHSLGVIIIGNIIFKDQLLYQLGNDDVLELEEQLSTYKYLQGVYLTDD